MAQTLTEIELVIHDDGSDDGTFERAEAWAGMDARIRFSRSPSSGRGHARNLAVEQARGEVIVICDGDDVSHPHRFARIARALEQADVTWSAGRGSRHLPAPSSAEP